MAYTDYEMQAYYHLPLSALTSATLEYFGRLLDPACTTLSKRGLQQDWQGLAELMEYSYENIKIIQTMDKQTVFLIKSWSQKVNSNLGQLAEMIEQLERYDILEDSILGECIARDATTREEKEDKHTDYCLEVNSSATPDVDYDPEYRCITVGEVETGKTEFFDAMVNYHEDDIEFVNNLESMVKTELGVKLFRRERDLLGGCPNESILLHVLEHKVRAMILVLSPNFLKCDLCDFLVKCALISKSNIRLLPIVILRDFKMPPYLRHLTNISYTKPEQAASFWERIRGFFRNLSTSQKSEEPSTDVTSATNADVSQAEARDDVSLGEGDVVLHQSPGKSKFTFQKKTKHSLKKSRKTIFGKRKLKKD